MINSGFELLHFKARIRFTLLLLKEIIHNQLSLQEASLNDFLKLFRLDVRWMTRSHWVRVIFRSLCHIIRLVVVESFEWVPATSHAASLFVDTWPPMVLLNIVAVNFVVVGHFINELLQVNLILCTDKKVKETADFFLLVVICIFWVFFKEVQCHLEGKLVIIIPLLLGKLLLNKVNLTVECEYDCFDCLFREFLQVSPLESLHHAVDIREHNLHGSIEIKSLEQLHHSLLVDSLVQVLNSFAEFLLGETSSFLAVLMHVDVPLEPLIDSRVSLLQRSVDVFQITSEL